MYRDLGDKHGSAVMVDILAEAACMQADFGRALALYRESVTLFQAVRNDVGGVACCLEGLARAAYAQGQLERAVRLLGTAAGLRAARGVPLRPHDRTIRDHMVATTRTVLGHDAFAVAWAAGQATPLEQAIAEMGEKPVGQQT